jgi:hypothetical protein
MNIATCQSYFKQINQEKFNNIIDFSNVVFELSRDDGVFLTLKNGKYTIGIGKAVHKDQCNRALTVMYMDITLGIKNESDRMANGYSEFATSVAKKKYKFFKPEYVWIEKDGKLVRDQIVEELKTNCILKTNGRIEKTKIYGIQPKEYRFVEKGSAPPPEDEPKEEDSASESAE